MSIDFDELRALSTEEKLKLVEFLCDELGEPDTPIPLPEWVDEEAARRRREMDDPAVGMSHEETWKKIQERHE